VKFQQLPRSTPKHPHPGRCQHDRSENWRISKQEKKNEKEAKLLLRKPIILHSVTTT